MTEKLEKKFFKAIRSGDRKKIDSAFEMVYSAYAKLVAFVVGEYITDRETIKEVVNDVFVSLFNHAESVNGNLKYYLTVSAKNAAINRSKRERSFNLPLEYADSSCEFEPRSQIIGELKKALSIDEVEIILLHVVEGYTFKEIAKKLCKNQNTVITTYNRAIKKFKKEAVDNE